MKPLIEELEILIDRYSCLEDAMRDLSQIASMKADHIHQSYSDTPLAGRWESAADVLDKTADRISKLGI